MPLSRGTVLNDRYEIEKVLGVGGFGITYRAWDVLENCRVAIKENYPSYLVARGDDNSVIVRGDERAYRWALRHFITESELLSGMDHPNIVQGYGILRENNTAYFVMEYLEGTPLSKYRKPSSWDEDSLSNILCPLLEALMYLEARNICHRDLKPDNIIIRPDGTPVLIDFGAAKQERSDESYSCSFMSSGYTAPEQIADHNCISPAIDIYALGATLYFLITGAVPDKAPARQLNPNHDTYIPLADNPKLLRRFSQPFLMAIDAALCLSPHHRLRNADDWRRALVTPRPLLSTSGAAANSGAHADTRMPVQTGGEPAPLVSRDDDEIIPIGTLLLWSSNFLLIVGALLFIAIMFSLSAAAGSSHSLDSCFPLAIFMIVLGAAIRVVLRFIEPD
ncbi:MAG: serine/threonine-protein kinase [Akkermansia sp.]|nr:serine/threonine-protein kinase [Akkermansia sp.]